MNAMIMRVSDIKIIANQKIRRIIVQTMYELAKEEIRIVEEKE
ncbi:MAG: hypothetical protein V1715_01510 [bacterium]